MHRIIQEFDGEILLSLDQVVVRDENSDRLLDDARAEFEGARGCLVILTGFGRSIHGRVVDLDDLRGIPRTRGNNRQGNASAVFCRGVGGLLELNRVRGGECGKDWDANRAQ